MTIRVEFFPAVLAAFLLAGCANVRITNPPRTATEQFLLSSAAAEAVAGLSFDPLFGRKVYLDTSHFAASGEAFVIGELRAALLMAGVPIMRDPNEAQIIVEVRSSGVGIDRYENLTGIPPLAAPAGAGAAAAGPEGAAAATLITPELAISKNIRQISFASIAYVAYWKDSGEIVTSQGPSIGRAWREDWWLFGMGPKSVGSIITTNTETETE